MGRGPHERARVGSPPGERRERTAPPRRRGNPLAGPSPRRGLSHPPGPGPGAIGAEAPPGSARLPANPYRPATDRRTHRARPRGVRPIRDTPGGGPPGPTPERGVIIDAGTAWASPGLVSTPDAAAVAYVTVTFAVTVATSDPRPGAEPVDAITAALLGQGFRLLTDTAQHPALQAAPALSGWSAALIPAPRIRITAPDGLFYDGDLGPAIPDHWHAATRARGRLTVLVATQLDLHQPDRTQQTQRALHDGRLLAGHISLQAPPG